MGNNAPQAENTRPRGRPITNQTARAKRRRENQRAYRAVADGTFICHCGGPKSDYARQCRRCSNEEKHRNAKPDKAYSRAYMAARRAKSAEERLIARLLKRPIEPKVCKTRLCDLYRKEPHHHCDCGLPIRLDVFACAYCLAEQKRLEFKTWEAA